MLSVWTTSAFERKINSIVDVLQKPVDTVLKYVPWSTDLVKVKHEYTVPYETGLLMILYQLSCPNIVRCDMEVKFTCSQTFISGVFSTFIDALYTIALPYLMNLGLFHHQFLVFY
jgi:hypothetical protein